jgi:hypothetical protein
MKRALIGLATLTLLLGGVGQAQADLIFNFRFDNSGGGPDGTIGKPIVGTGKVSFATDPGNGTFALSSLGTFSMSFKFPDATYTDANIASDNSLTQVKLFNVGSERRLAFTDAGSGAGGPLLGSLDLVNGNFGLSFEPASFGGYNLYSEGPTAAPNNSVAVPAVAGNFGNYLALHDGAARGTPEPGSLTLVGLALASLGACAWRRKRKGAQAAAG